MNYIVFIRELTPLTAGVMVTDGCYISNDTHVYAVILLVHKFITHLFIFWFHI